MNTLKIQIKPFYKNNPFHLKDDQIHILSTNKNEEKMIIFADIYNEVILYVLQKIFKNRRTSINAFYSKTNFFNI